MFSPIGMSGGGKRNRSDKEVAEWEKRRAKPSKGYDESPWLTALVTFSGFVAAFIGSVVVLLIIANLRNGTVWLSYALILAALVGAHLCLRAVRYRRRHARQSGAEDRRQAASDRHPETACGPGVDQPRSPDPIASGRNVSRVPPPE
jgi:hypothetical protein